MKQHSGGGAQISAATDKYSHQTHEKTRNTYLFSCDFVDFVANNTRYRKLSFYSIKLAVFLAGGWAET
jgi:hypothetical protein